MSEQSKPFKLYSNEIQIGVTLFDITMQFKHVTPEDQETLGTITISPQHAKSLLSALSQNVAQYEEIFGKINENDAEKFKMLQEQGIIKVGPQ